jgi:small-conductance mechanosensitive channel
MTEVLGVRLIGLTIDNLRKLAVSIVLIATMAALRWALMRTLRRLGGEQPHQRVVFWARQVSAIVVAVVVGLGLVSIWFDNPARLALPFGIVSAGIAFALQKVITALAGYVVVLRGKTFRVGDRIVMGGVRGDVIALGFTQTTILEMGLPPALSKDDPTMWVQARQYTGRVVTVTNDKVFDAPVFNYSRLLPFIWEELRLLIRYEANRRVAERILLDCARDETLDVRQLSRADRERVQREYFVDLSDCDPRVYFRMTDNWLELSVRFVVEPRGVREVLDRMTRAILDRLDEAGIAVASQTHDVVRFPPVRLEGTLAERLAEALVRLADERHAAPPSLDRR